MLMRGEALMPTMMRRSAYVVLQARFPHMRLDEGYMHSRAGSRECIVDLHRVHTIRTKSHTKLVYYLQA